MTFLPNETMKKICERLQSIPILADPGDALFFDCNLMHCSGHNLSPHDRRAAIVAYNADDNRPPGHQDWPLVQRESTRDILKYKTIQNWRPRARTEK